jgi:hypothetical protein
MKAHLFAMCGLLFVAGPAVSAPEQQASSGLAPAAQITTPPGPTKARLIRRYLELVGIQRQIDTGSFLERYALPGGPMWQVPATGNTTAKSETIMGAVEARFAALKNAYASQRSAYQQAYESHVNWEFTEGELAEIVSFLERPVGKHFLDGRWRMEAYVGTDTEDLEQQIVAEATASLAK